MPRRRHASSPSPSDPCPVDGLYSLARSRADGHSFFTLAMTTNGLHFSWCLLFGQRSRKWLTWTGRSDADQNTRSHLSRLSLSVSLLLCEVVAYFIVLLLLLLLLLLPLLRARQATPYVSSFQCSIIRRSFADRITGPTDRLDLRTILQGPN